MQHRPLGRSGLTVAPIVLGGNVFGWSADEAASFAVLDAATDAGLNAEDVDYVNAHATATPVGDACEARVLALAFGDHVRNMPVSSTKSMTGHLLSGAAAIEALACLVAIRHGAVPPTINLHKPDPACPLRHVANEAIPHRVRVAARPAEIRRFCAEERILR